MPCESRRSLVIQFGLCLLLAPAVVLPARAQQEADRPPAPFVENSIDRWNRMSPEERERELAKLPPARARLIRQRIKRYNQMNPQAQQDLRQRYQTFSQLPPDIQQVIRKRLREFRQLPADRHPAVHQEVEKLRLLPEPQRQASMNSDDFRTRFSPQEQQIIRDLSAYLPN